MKQQDGKDGRRDLTSIDDPLQDSKHGPGLWEYAVVVLLLVCVVVWLLVLLGPQIAPANMFHNISNDI